MRTRSNSKKIRKYLLQDQIRDKENPLISIWIRHEKSGTDFSFRIRLGTKMHKLFNAWCERFGGGKPVTAFRFFFKGKLIDGEQTAADIDIRRAIDLDVLAFIDEASSFNQPLNNWDVSNVTDMRRMFNGARSFNHHAPWYHDEGSDTVTYVSPVGIFVSE